jgi:hypothetical protein
MSLNADLREFIELLNSRGVEYVIVGAHSLAFHARPRYTGDLDESVLWRISYQLSVGAGARSRELIFTSLDLRYNVA